MEEYWKILKEGQALYEGKKYEEARKKFSRVIQLKKEHPEAYYCRGHALFALKKYKEAVQDFTTCLPLKKDDYGVLSSRAFAFNLLKKHEEAIRDCDKAIKLYENCSLAYSQRGNAYLGLQRYNDSIRDCSKSIELNKSTPYPYYYRGVAYKNLGKCTESIRDLSKAIELCEKTFFFEDLSLENAIAVLDEVSKLQKKRVTFVQQFFACQDSVVIEESWTKDEVFFLGKKGIFGGQKRSKVFEGSFKNGVFHGKGVVFEQETGKELYKGIWDDGLLNSYASGRNELETLFAMKNQEITCLRKEVSKLKEGLSRVGKESKLLLRVKAEENTRLSEGIKKRDLQLQKRESIIMKTVQELENKDDVIKKKDRRLKNFDDLQKRNIKTAAKLTKLEEELIQTKEQNRSCSEKTAQEKTKLRDDMEAQRGVIESLKRVIESLRERNIQSALKKITLKEVNVDFVQPIGSGACADVFGGHLETKVALKRIKMELVRDKRVTLSDAQSECKKIGCLNHENVIKCFGVVYEPSKHFLGILTELGKESLESAVKKKSLNISKKISLMRELAEGMVFLHENRIVHKDLNLRNVLIGFDDKIKIIDFGISKEMIEMKSKILNTSVRGTPFFFAPEILMFGKNVEISKLCDVFSFGVVCYCFYHEKTEVKDLEVLLYEGISPMSGAGQIQISKLLSNTKWKPKDPKGFDRSKISMKEKAFLDLVASCLQVLPHKRPSFKEIVVDLKKIEKLKD